MANPVAAAYDASPYPEYVFWFTHPDHLAAMGTVFGLSPAPIARARILDLGCGTGANLLGIAASLPEATCVGIDLSPVQIAHARAHAETARLTNVTFVLGDLREFLAADHAPFDYIIAHGLYSWVDPATQQALLTGIGQSLAPHGVAYVSYNTYPGWHMADMVRRLMLLHTAGEEHVDARLEQAVAITRWLHRRTLKNPNDWRDRAIDRELATIRDNDRSLLLHDLLSTHNNPVYFLDFVRAAEDAGLQYMANASPWDMALENQDPELVETLTQLGDLLTQQQYLDFANHARFRRTLLARTDAPVTREVHAERVMRFFVTSGMFEDPGLAGIEAGTPVPVRIPNRPVMHVSAPILRLALHLIWQAGRRPLHFDELARDVMTGLRARGLDGSMTDAPDADARVRARLAGQLLRAFFADAVKFGVRRPPIARVLPERPTTGRWQRQQAVAGELATNLGHEPFPLSPAQRKVLAALDGHHECAALQGFIDAPIEEVLAGLLQFGFVLEPDEAAAYT